MVKDYKSMKDRLIEQKITKIITIADGVTDYVKIPIPSDKTVFLKGYGYSYSALSEFQLSTGNTTMPVRQDQEGSITQPMVWAQPWPTRSGRSVSFEIKNGSGASATYNVVFYFLTDIYLEEPSTGGEMIQSTTGSASLPSNVIIQNPAGTIQADVIARGDGTNALAVDTELTISGATFIVDNVNVASTDGAKTGHVFIKADANGNIGNAEIVNATNQNTSAHTTSVIGSSTTLALAVNTARKSALIINDSDETIYIKIGVNAVLNEGIRLNANGGAYEMSFKYGNLDTRAINAISSSGSKTVLITETV